MKNLSKASTAKSFVILASITIIEKILSFIYQALTAGLIGANSITDAYFSASEFFTAMDSTLLNAMVIALLGTYTSIVVEKSDEQADKFLINIIKIVIPFIFIISFLIFTFSNAISYIIAPGFESNEREILIRDIKLMSFVMVITSLTDIFLVILRYKKNFFIVGLKSLFISVSGITFVLISHFTKLYVDNILSIGYIVAYVSYCVIVTFSVKGFRFIKFGIPKWTDVEKNTLKNFIPLIISNGIVSVSLLIDRILCSTLGEGSVSFLTYSQTLYNFVASVFIINLSTILLSDFNELISLNKFEEAYLKLKKSVNIMVILLIPISIIAIIYHNEIVKIVFERGNFIQSDVQKVGKLLMIYSISFVPSVISNIYMQVHYAAGKINTSMKYSVYSILSNIILSVILVHAIGIGGVAAGTTISNFISMSLYSKSINSILPVKEFKIFSIKDTVYKFVISGIICCCFVYCICKLINNPYISFVFAVFLGLTSYFSSLAILKEPHIINYVEKIKIYNKKHNK